MSLFKGEAPSLGTTEFIASNKGDKVITVKSAAGAVVATIDDTGAMVLSGGGRVFADHFTVKGISPIVTPATSGTAWIAPRAVKVLTINEAHSAGATGVTINVRKITDASAPSAAAGATVKELLSAALAADSTNNTVVNGALSATAADLSFAAGDKLCWNASGTLTSYVGEITVEFETL